ncbi:MAG: beta-lactamase domain protein [Pseudonocardiales bacterium]|nr:beta-lactamase domain protein [Pseudonocardiales bacterium]
MSENGPTTATLKIGQLQVTGIYDGMSITSIDSTFNRLPVPADTPPELVQRGRTTADWRDHQGFLIDGELPLTFGGYLITGCADRVILVDAGFGPNVFEPYKSDWCPEIGLLPANLGRRGYELGDVTDVVVTHLHTDHVGWIGHDGEALMPNATVHVNRRDVDHFFGRDARITPILEPVMERLDAVDGLAEIAPGVTLTPAYGHTPGNCTVRVQSDGDSLLLVGDTFHSPLEFTEENWAGLGDLDVVRSHQVRSGYISRLVDSGTWIGGAHFPDLAFGQIVGDSQGGRAWTGPQYTSDYRPHSISAHAVAHAD